ncbi:hypothetical protein CVN56_30535 [Rhodococcus sp. AQ5-07]|jgi:hypothetical protein|nr:CopG family antitoxin [Rhodococcus sp. AQ5-07]RAL30953.1 hypothetical protein CVN56_30535 [Rhodococcus sp. AQ5-07]
MDPTKMAELRDYYDDADTSALIEESILDETVDQAPMVGITVRLPAAVLNRVREQAGERGIKTTALIREWVEDSVADETDDDSMVRFSDVKKLFARAVPAATEQQNVHEGAVTTIKDFPKQVDPEHQNRIPNLYGPRLDQIVHGPTPTLHNFQVQILDLQISGVWHGDRLAMSDGHLISTARQSTGRK